MHGSSCEVMSKREQSRSEQQCANQWCCNDKNEETVNQAKDAIKQLYHKNHLPSDNAVSTSAPIIDKTSSPTFNHSYDICTQHSQCSDAIVSIQIETAFQGVRDSQESRKQWAKNFAVGVMEFCKIHFS
jgi:hypothetical protein